MSGRLLNKFTMEDKVSIKIFNYEDIDQQAYCTFQKTVFSPILKQAGFDDSFFNPLFFKWKYNTPFGKAYIAVAEKNGKMVGSICIIPLNIIRNGFTQRSWQACELAVLPEERGKGYFSDCISQIKSKINEGEYLWAFPNKNSMKGFLNSGFVKKCSITLWIRPLLYLNRKVHLGRALPPDETDFALPGKACVKDDICLEKTREYFSWRYVQHPCYKYYLEEITGPDYKGMFVFRELSIKGTKLLMIMDYAGCFKAARKIFSRITAFAKANNIHYIGNWGNTFSNFQMLQLGFLPVPDIMLPKKQILCTQLIDGVNQNDKNKWAVQTGDYDLF